MVVQVIRVTYNDDSFATTDVDVMVCPSKEYAKDFILKEMCEGFGGNWKDLHEVATELDKDLSLCDFSEDESEFMWSDNGKGETYHIQEINGVKLEDESTKNIEVGSFSI